MSLPELFESCWIRLGVADGVLDVALPQVILDKPRIYR
jgi:hypothetical protein